uniref:Fork-head domain-containing protein n=2 Tax=Monopterus albus TaxID=43700 RepID=A0A3Q3J6F9_MONAL|nr:forkhead box protein H1 isoform X2 [Monopterus albus]XP_020465244.1 forkhead box protein H1 isoform X2 [Monopterus albus]XP_020465245.1 forkhead box protein H1 isoform X2 [Monopterus albus]XP_020465246.1 forkhead box protein H1 isoform X2 [Monopterus albus]XP_020465247.1 forkhead box protein H1 isoform X2 [Monopterus albus]XP_020465248.1 forkhead box protein H1 isoform X2 [Monopterus albus]XP_020465249.1 forkhead box protein H1 isoform X2 [Monopterus albus]XP_020465250.1 forkhead box prot
MTKHWQSFVAPPALSHLGEHQLGFHRRAQHSFPTSGVTRSSPAQHWPRDPAQMVPKQPPRSEKPAACPEHLTGVNAVFMDKASETGSSCPNAQANNSKLENITQNSGTTEQKSSTRGGKKKNYQRYPKPPYSYLAMIAMVIQRSPEKKLTLSEILKEISALFPFFKGNYKGWRDSVRHNLSSYDCFVKVLKDPGKPQGKGNFWAVDLSRVPLELLKRQNTAVSRQDETIFAQDLAPYILQGHKPESELPSDPVTSFPPLSSGNPSPPQEDLFQPKLDSSFAIDSLLHSLQPTSAPGDVNVTTRDCWGEVERTLSSPPPRPRYTSSAHSASASSSSPGSIASSSDEEWKGLSLSGKRVPLDGDAGSNGREDYRPPLHKSARRETIAPPWELPTSYAKYAPPNAVAPPSMRFNGGPLMPLHGRLPLYGYGSPPMAPGHFLGHAYWPILPSGRVSVPAPPIYMDLDSMLQSVPPNKSVFDVLVPTNQNSHPHHQPPSQYTLQNGPPLSRYPQY